jgi:hypothetical protein
MEVCVLFRLGLFVIVIGLGGCGPRETKVSSTSHEVIVNHLPERRQAADQVAAATCANYGRATRLRYRYDQYATMDQFGVYDCVLR